MCNSSDPFGLCPWHDVACLEDQMWAASGGTGVAGRILAPLASTLLEATGISGVDQQAKTAAASGSIGDKVLLGLQIGLAAAPGGGELSTASERLLGDAISGVGSRNVIAGAGSRKAIGDIGRLVTQYGGEAGDWAKMVGGSEKVGGRTVQIHWYENVKTGLKTEFKQNLPGIVP
jgi:hypothetical protein